LRILVTGGAGYIGSVVASELLRSGHEVLVYDNLSHGHREVVPPQVKLVVGEIADRRALDGVFGGQHIDAVMHFAALIEAGESMQVPERYFLNNTAGTLSLLDAMVAHGVERFVFSSTAAVYGEPECVPIVETASLKPTNVYGESKLLIERVLEWLHRTRGLRYASLRYFNAAGACGQLGEAHHPESHLIPLILRVALGQRESISIFGSDYPTDDGTCIRDYIHVADLANAHVLALGALDSAGQLIYNLGNGRGFSVRAVIEVARRITGHAIPAVETPRRPGDPAILVASSEKIRRELHWQPRFPDLETIVATAWEWHRQHPQGYRS
jgi:UDP-glucose 4-epimerase